jgi:hypothetical protein
MNPISTAEMIALRAEVAAAACDTPCTIKRPVKTPDGRLTNTVTYSTIATVNCGIKATTVTNLRSSHALTQEQINLFGVQVVWEINFPWGTNVQAQDHLFIGSDELVALIDVSLQSYSTLNTMIAGEIK